MRKASRGSRSPVIFIPKGKRLPNSRRRFCRRKPACRFSDAKDLTRNKSGLIAPMPLEIRSDAGRRMGQTIQFLNEKIRSTHSIPSLLRCQSEAQQQLRTLGPRSSPAFYQVRGLICPT